MLRWAGLGLNGYMSFKSAETCKNTGRQTQERKDQNLIFIQKCLLFNFSQINSALNIWEKLFTAVSHYVLHSLHSFDIHYLIVSSIICPIMYHINKTLQW